MSALKKLAGQTAIYGLPSIIGRLLNYFLVPLHTYYFLPNQFGIVSELYAYVGFFVILLMMGMETTFFRFVNKAKDKEKTFNQAFSIVLVINVIFLLFIFTSYNSIASWIGYPQYGRFIIWFGLILSFDAISSLLLAKLRFLNEPRRFATIQLASIGTNIIFNLFFLYFFVERFDGEGIAYIFLANLMASLIKPVLLLNELRAFRFTMDASLSRQMLFYSFPLMIGGFAGIINETFDRILIKNLLLDQGNEYAESQVGIYSANYKLSILITLFITAFRYAAEPFFFSQANEKDKNKVYSRVMTYFVIVVALIFLTVSLNLSIFKLFIPNEAYWEGLVIVPILLLANVFLGIYYNQSIWYKLADKTRFGAYIAVGGAVITIVLNIILIPLMGYLGAAITTFTVYLSMMLASYYFGQIHYPIKYNLRKIGLYLIGAVVLYFIGRLTGSTSTEFSWGGLVINLMLLGIFIGIVFFIERPLQTLKKKR